MQNVAMTFAERARRAAHAEASAQSLGVRRQ
jgi:hypothetical protein